MVIIEESKKQEIMAIRGQKLFNNAFSHPFIVDKDSVSALSWVKGKLKTALVNYHQ